MVVFNKYSVLNWLAQTNYNVMLWIDSYWWSLWGLLFLVGGTISMAPIKIPLQHDFADVVLVKIRHVILIISAILFLMPIIMLYIYDTTQPSETLQSNEAYLAWFGDLAIKNWHVIPVMLFTGWAIRVMTKRYLAPSYSALLRKLRNTQTSDTPSDIRSEAEKYKAKVFVPEKYYNKKSIVIGIGEDNKPLTIPNSTWYETNMQVIGPTRYGKGVILGCLMDQAIRRGDQVIYIDPKKDKFAPHIMYKACLDSGRKFYYLTLHDEGIGKWAPFAGGSYRDALSRFETAYGLEMTGDPGTDFYKSQERNILIKAFEKSRSIDKLSNLLADSEAHRIIAELNSWKQIDSLCPAKGRGFSIEKALQENAVVYVQGSLSDSVVKTATKIFIIEVIQESMRLEKERSAHLSLLVDEVRFLVSKQLTDALATAVGFNVNIVTAYQSINDLLNPDDKTLNGRSLLQSVNVNSQVKAVYGGADYDTADWAQKLSGSIQKEVTKFEKTNVSAIGGETWDNGRTVGNLEEAQIHANTILTLPPRVCALFRPNKLGMICFTSYVSVKDNSLLDAYLDSKAKIPHAELLVSEPLTDTSKNSNIDLVLKNPSKPEVREVAHGLQESNKDKNKARRQKQKLKKKETKQQDDMNKISVFKNIDDEESMLAYISESSDNE